MSRRPNLLLIHSDSLDGRAMGCAGHPAAYTPNLDRLAGEGVLFDRAYCASPVCVPSRVATWCGAYPHRHDAWNNACGLADDTPTFLPQLERAGYLIHAIGRDDRSRGSHSFSLRLRAWTRAADVVLPGYPPWVVTETDKCERVRDIDWRYTDEAIAWLSQRSLGEPPFFLSLVYIQPHPGSGYRTSPHYLDRVDPAMITAPPTDRDEHPVVRRGRLNKGALEGFTDTQVLDLRYHYLGMVAEVDAQVGLVLDAIEQASLAESTIVVFFSEHGQWRKSTMYESSARVSLLVRGPGLPRGTVRDDLASLVDLSPTLLDLAGVDERRATDGVSLFADTPDPRRCVFAEYHESLQPTRSFMARTGPWKLVHYAGHAPPLFHLDDDPDEIEDLATRRPDVVAELDGRLRRAMDVDAIDARAKAYDVDCFTRWRAMDR